MVDSKGRQGGSSDLKLVGTSDDTSCLNSNSPTSVSVFPTPSSSSSASSSSASGTSAAGHDGSSNTSKPSVGVIIAAICAALLGIGAIISLVVVFLRRRKNQGNYFPGYGRRSQFHAVDLGSDPFAGTSDDHLPPAQLNPYPFTNASMSNGTSPSSHNLLHSDSQYGSDTYPPMQSAYGPSTQSRRYTGTESGMVSPTAGSSSGDGTSTWQSPSIATSAARGKAAAAGITSYKPPPRFILHTDLEELHPPQEEEEVIELPPQYSESRAPIPGLTIQPPRPVVTGKPPIQPDNSSGPSGSASPPYQ